MIRAVLSDLGRVVLWFDNNIFLRKLAERAGKPFPEVKARVHGNLPLIRSFDAGAVTPQGFHERVSQTVGVAMPYGEFYGIYNDIFSLNEPVLGLLQRVKAVATILVLVSNTDPERFGFIRRTFPRIFLFDDYVLSYEVNLLKPGPEIFREAVRRAGVEPRECVLIDDMEDNIKGASAVGLHGIRYTPETDLETELTALGLNF
jgi:HAD superfamily hydrolase (TIGR01509 family)